MMLESLIKIHLTPADAGTMKIENLFYQVIRDQEANGESPVSWNDYCTTIWKMVEVDQTLAIHKCDVASNPRLTATNIAMMLKDTKGNRFNLVSLRD